MRWLLVLALLSCGKKPTSTTDITCTEACFPKDAMFFPGPTVYAVCLCNDHTFDYDVESGLRMDDCVRQCGDNGGVAGYALVQSLCACREPAKKP